MKISDQLTRELTKLESKVINSAIELYSIAISNTSKDVLKFSPLVKLAGDEVITQFDGHYVTIGGEQEHLSSLHIHEIILIISHIENKYYEK